jgi:hypothetical protein
MIYGLDEQGKFFVEYTACERPIGNVRQEMERACTRLANEGRIMISLSSGLDSQVLLHTFHTLNLPYECAFMHHPGYNDIELSQIRKLEQKYNFDTQVVVIDPDQYREEVEDGAAESGIPPEHHLMKKFVAQLPEDRDILQGIESYDFVFKDGRCYCMESWTAIEIASQRALQEVPRSGKIVAIDRRAPFNEFALAYLADPVVTGYLNALPYIRGNGLVEKETGEPPPLIFSWEYYVKPIIFGRYWGRELEYFPKYVSPEKIDWIMNPTDNRMRHNYRNRCVYIERGALIKLLSNWGSGETQRWEQHD